MKDYSLGSWIMTESITVAEIMADFPFEWLCIDMEHTATDNSQMKALMAVIQGKGKKAYVRVAENNKLEIKRALDAGADGLIIPMVNSLEEAEAAIEYSRYPSKGIRGAGLYRAQRYGLHNGFDNYVKEKADHIPIIIQIEHYKAIEALPEMLKLKDISGSFIGPFDLSGSIDLPGQIHHEKVQKLLGDYEKIADGFPNKLKGLHVVEPEMKQVKEKVNKGYNFIAFGIDTLFLGHKLIEEFKEKP